MIQLQLSPETPLARDGCHATRSVARAGTTHHLAASVHETKEYFPGRPLVKGEGPLNFRCMILKNVINGNQKFLGLRRCRGRPRQGGSLNGVQLGPAFVEIRLAQLGNLILVRTSVVPILVVQHVYHFHSLSIDVAER